MWLVDICFMRLSEYTIELVLPYDSNLVVSGMIKKYRNMPYHICYEADDFFEEIKCLELNGFTRMDEPCQASAIEGRKNAWMLELVKILHDTDRMDSDIKSFMGWLLEYGRITKPDEAVLNQSIDRIVIGKSEKINGKTVKEVRIVNNFVGKVTTDVK